MPLIMMVRPNYHGTEYERHGPETTVCTASPEGATAVYTALLRDQAVTSDKLQGDCPPSRFAASCLFVGSQESSSPA